ncbi:MAG TPA: glycosyltransferase family 2 protein [Candidatus Limnocylindria bacterium]|nr:glycosyltransferase family 2 protein [Candidatus Limnocylindria bacterium]
MRSRVLAAAGLLLSGAVAWLAVVNVVAARLLQILIATSIGYVAYLAWRGWAVIRRARAEAQPATGPLPWVTVVVPARDEAPVIADVVTDLAGQHYADERGPRFDVLVIDDGSADGTADLARAAGTTLEGRLAVVRREPGSGPRTKGAALAYAHHLVRGEIVAVMDADSMLASDYLSLAINGWGRDADAAALQTRRAQLNAPRGWLPAAQDEEHLMDLASQCGRWATDGTAEVRGTGMFLRRATLEAVGGWDQHTVTEDLEISTRLAAAGEHITLAPEAVVREEAVETFGALWAQRMRWAEGSIRRLVDLGPGLLADRRLPFRKRMDFLIFTTEFVVPPLFVASTAASLATIALPQPADWTVPVTLFVGYGVGTFLLAAAGLAATGTRGAAVVGRAARGSLFLSHWLVVVPLALLKIAFGPPSREFSRTPRLAHRDR